MTKVLIRKEITTQQLVGSGPGERPSIGQLWGAFRHGRGTTPGSKVGVGGRLAGLAGLAGKGAAMAATANQTAQAMQGGNMAAPLQAGVTYQGIDPTGKLTSGAIQGQAPPAPVAVSAQQQRDNMQQIQLPAPAPVAQTPTINPGGLKPHQSPPGTVGTLMPATQAPVAPALPAPAPASALPAPAPASASFARDVGQAMTTQTKLPSFAGDVGQAANNIQPQNQQTQEEIDAAHAAQQLQQYPQSTLQLSFADEVINRLGPDMVYKMTPHELGILSAYMYLKVR